jgi:hypothetical protein
MRISPNAIWSTEAWRETMHEPDLPASVLQAIEQRVKHRIRRQVIMAVLTTAFLLSVLVASVTPPGLADVTGRWWPKSYF